MRRTFLLFILTFVITIPTYSKNDPLVYLRYSDIHTLDPGRCMDGYSNEVISCIFEGLVRYKKGTQIIEPCLAKKWTMSEDGKKWTFFLKKGVYFHSGELFDAQSVVYSFTTRMDRSRREYHIWQQILNNIIKVKSRGSYIVEVSLNKPFAPFLSTLTETVAFIVPKGSLENPEFTPVGTGPFKFNRWKNGEYIIVEKNKNYWDGEISLSKIIFKIVTNPSRRIAQMKNHQVDLIELKSANEYSEFIGQRHVNIISHPKIATFYLGFNTRKKPFDKVDVRKAIAHLVDKKVLIKQVFQDFATPAVALLPPRILGFNKNLDHYPYNINTARNLLKKAGYGSGFSCTIYFLKDDIGEQKVVDAFMRNARKVNIKIIKKSYHFNVLSRKLKERKYDMVIRGWSAGPDPDKHLSPFFPSPPLNLGLLNYQNLELSNLLLKARETMNITKRRNLYEQVLDIIQREVPLIPLYHANYLTACNRRVKGIFVNNNHVIIFRDAYKVKN